MAAENGEHENHHTDGQNNDSQFFAEIIKTGLKRCFPLLGLVHERSDFTELCAHTRGGDNNGCPSIGYKRTGENHVDLVAEGYLFRRNGIGGFVDTFGFTSQ